MYQRLRNLRGGPGPESGCGGGDSTCISDHLFQIRKRRAGCAQCLPDCPGSLLWNQCRLSAGADGQSHTLSQVNDKEDGPEEGPLLRGGKRAWLAPKPPVQTMPLTAAIFVEAKFFASRCERRENAVY